MSTYTYQKSPYSWSEEQLLYVENKEYHNLDREGIQDAIDAVLLRKKIKFQRLIIDVLVGRILENYYNIDHCWTETTDLSYTKAEMTLKIYPSLKQDNKEELQKCWTWAVNRVNSNVRQTIKNIPETCPWDIDSLFSGVPPYDPCDRDLLARLKILRLRMGAIESNLEIKCTAIHLLTTVRDAAKRRILECSNQLLMLSLEYVYISASKDVKNLLQSQIQHNRNKLRTWIENDEEIADIFYENLRDGYLAAVSRCALALNVHPDTFPDECPWEIQEMLNYNSILG